MKRINITYKRVAIQSPTPENSLRQLCVTGSLYFAATVTGLQDILQGSQPSTTAYIFLITAALTSPGVFKSLNTPELNQTFKKQFSSKNLHLQLQLLLGMLTTFNGMGNNTNNNLNQNIITTLTGIVFFLDAATKLFQNNLQMNN